MTLQSYELKKIALTEALEKEAFLKPALNLAARAGKGLIRGAKGTASTLNRLRRPPTPMGPMTLGQGRVARNIANIQESADAVKGPWIPVVSDLREAYTSLSPVAKGYSKQVGKILGQAKEKAAQGYKAVATKGAVGSLKDRALRYSNWAIKNPTKASYLEGGLKLTGGIGGSLALSHLANAKQLPLTSGLGEHQYWGQNPYANMRA